MKPKPVASLLAQHHTPTEIAETASYDEVSQLWVSPDGVRAEPVTQTATIKTIRIYRDDGTSTTTTEPDSKLEVYY